MGNYNVYLDMNYFTKIIFILLYISISTSQIIEEHSLFDENGIEVDVFAFQIPENYNPNNAHPLLVAFHQWGGNQMSPFNTQFDEEANARNWIFMSPFGGSPNNYNHQDAQEWVKQGILWLEENYNVDERRIYMVGGSMGGASGAIYGNNHLDPTEPMVAATASASGILDCERRAIEMDGNNSMIEWFGGNYDEVPFEYHRNSAVYFADSTQSMHYNLQYTPLYLDFGETETHRTHAEDLYNLLFDYNDNMWMDTIPTGSHGYSVIDEMHTCDWFSQFELEDNPNLINVNLDEPGRAYWIEPINSQNEIEFIRVNSNKMYPQHPDSLHILNFIEVSNTDSILIYEILDGQFNYLQILITEPIYQGVIFGLTGKFAAEIYATVYMGYEMGTIEPELSNGVHWFRFSDLEIYDSIFDNISIEIHYENLDVNQDEIWDILDIVLTVNFIMQTLDPTNVQFDSADLNNDNIVDILDIVIMVNMIMEQ
jgi:pimeloyl-ACP methyl ester carboxylesterase